MKSANKVLYNHRIAQSKELWEKGFLSKIKDGNDLLYLAANKNFGWGKVNDSLYTANSRNSIISHLDEIINNPYNKRNHPDFAGLKEAAIAKLDEKIKSNEDKNNKIDTPVVTAPGGIDVLDPSRDSTLGTRPPVANQVFKEDNFSNQAQTIIDQLKSLDLLAQQSKEGKDDQFKFQWNNRKKEILAQVEAVSNILSIEEKSEIDRRLQNLENEWIDIFYPFGFKRVGRGMIIPADRVEAAEDLIDKINLDPDTKKIQKLIEKYHHAFVKDTPIEDSQMQTILVDMEKAINKRNFNHKFEGSLIKPSRSEFRRGRF